MKRLVLTFGLSLGLGLGLAGTGPAKGPTRATITGPGLGQPILLTGDPEENASSRFGQLVAEGGFFPQVFEQVPDSTSRARPAGQLGPGYDVVYLVPRPNGGRSTVRQQLYPYAASGPVSYLRPGQPVFEGMDTHGGWYRSPVSLRSTLVALGFPKQRPSLSQSGLGPGAWAGIGAGIALALGAAGALIVRRRRGESPV
jgi:hypothetical protein